MGGDIRHVSTDIRSPQTVAYDKTFMQEETKVIRLQRNPPFRLLVKEYRQLHAAGAPSQKVAHQEFAGDPGFYQCFDQQDVAAFYVGFRGEKDLRGAGVGLPGLHPDKLADYWNFQMTNQIG